MPGMTHQRISKAKHDHHLGFSGLIFYKIPGHITLQSLQMPERVIQIPTWMVEGKLNPSHFSEI